MENIPFSKNGTSDKAMESLTFLMLQKEIQMVSLKKIEAMI